MNDLYEEDYALEELENLKAKTEMFKSATNLMKILTAVFVLSGILAIIGIFAATSLFDKFIL